MSNKTILPATSTTEVGTPEEMNHGPALIPIYDDPEARKRWIALNTWYTNQAETNQLTVEQLRASADNNRYIVCTQPGDRREWECDPAPLGMHWCCNYVNVWRRMPHSQLQQIVQYLIELSQHPVYGAETRKMIGKHMDEFVENLAAELWQQLTQIALEDTMNFGWLATASNRGHMEYVRQILRELAVRDYNSAYTLLTCKSDYSGVRRELREMIDTTLLTELAEITSQSAHGQLLIEYAEEIKPAVDNNTTWQRLVENVLDRFTGFSRYSTVTTKGCTGLSMKRLLRMAHQITEIGPWEVQFLSGLLLGLDQGSPEASEVLQRIISVMTGDNAPFVLRYALLGGAHFSKTVKTGKFAPDALNENPVYNTWFFAELVAAVKARGYKVLLMIDQSYRKSFAAAQIQKLADGDVTLQYHHGLGRKVLHIGPDIHGMVRGGNGDVLDEYLGSHARNGVVTIIEHAMDLTDEVALLGVPQTELAIMPIDFEHSPWCSLHKKRKTIDGDMVNTWRLNFCAVNIAPPETRSAVEQHTVRHRAGEAGYENLRWV